MSTSNAAAGPSTSDYARIFCPVINSYNEFTGQDLKTRCTASNLVNPTAVLNVFRDRMQGFEEFRNGNEALMTCLQSTVDHLFTISTKLNLGDNVNSDSEIVSVKAFLSYQAPLDYLFLSYPRPRKQSAPLSLFSSAWVSSNDSPRAFS